MEGLNTILPEALLFIVSGFCFIKVYCFVYIYKGPKDVEKMLMASLVVGFIIYKFASMIPISFGKNIDTICIMVCSIIAGFVLGKILSSHFIVRILDKLKIRKSLSEHLWNNILDRDYIMIAHITMDDGKKYSGKIHEIEEFVSTPQIVLADYSIDGIRNKNDRQVIVLNTANAKEVIIEYNENSPMLKEISFNESC